ncbi:GNAT family N-acetyltransferase [Brevibacillus antibioticus]|uniref:GNAT family N-acetyltransferase n=1 Tax=Brevibacillus antibioticus TaxID=2570228 RepID=A0A4V5TIH8_9BACL|nr:GNAT family N-acetyltransferase [Brevibacillus antibioticus]TKI55143.1 GNAT family N-acetyltransferase [Brevibacillus antibioticus]
MSQHSAEIYHHFSSKDVTKFMDIEPCKDIREAEEIIQFHLDDSGCRWGLFDITTSGLIGTAGFHLWQVTKEFSKAEIGYDLAKEYWGIGLMQEAVIPIIDFGFTTMKLDLIEATVDPANLRSTRLLNRLGFQKQKELKDNLVYSKIRLVTAYVS